MRQPSPNPTSSAASAGFYDPLMAYARDPEDSVTLTFVSAIELARSSSRLGGRPAFGLDEEAFRGLLNRYFPGAEDVYLTPATKAALAAANRGRRMATDEFEDLVVLLLEHRSEDSAESRWLAYAIAACCMGDDHLWQDMGLPDRQSLSDLLARHFSTLFARNTGGMRWKKFFYKQLCEREGAFVCRSPSCAECVEYSNCFGPEEDSAWQPAKR
ncbi:nitrogen fixation protein nifQ [Methylocaldum marinum]|uniref:Nitrogen fixation protein nifQ n=1 Tax=Methylocaldum marinum TaxID=1432792 RepID=A0A250L0N1_9GAMM|nr:nitrogen fixation protein NifQ [Methylocaldum marinum]BBA37392.1 nitrogen fixation protein nifQ [Methylocaldum marinum]